MHGRPALGVVTRIGAAVVVFGAVLYALVPFSAPARTLFDASPVVAPGGDAVRDGSLSVSAVTLAGVPTSSCGAAAIDAWHAKSPPSGWFGYAPLVAVPMLTGSRCRAESGRRLSNASVALFGAIALLLAARWIDRRPGLAGGPATNPAL